MKYSTKSQPTTSHFEKKSLIKFLIFLVLIACLAVLAMRYGWDITGWLRHPDQVREALLGLGGWGVFGFIALQVLGILLVVIPGDLVSICGGYLYGVPWGFFLAWSSAMLGSILAFSIARLLGYDFVSRLFPQKAVEQCNRVLNSRMGTLGMVVAFLVPVFPKDVLVFAAGLMPISASRLIFSYAIARIPNTLVWVMVGANLYKGDPLLLFAALSFAAILLGGALLFQRRHLQSHFSRGGEDQSSLPPPSDPPKDDA
ncbi:MAG: TVP38/TMEM64 family protein [Clostridia bacterium]|nr:TVP38/TMEM64 family protein [Clostridia bacterium]